MKRSVFLLGLAFLLSACQATALTGSDSTPTATETSVAASSTPNAEVATHTAAAPTEVSLSAEQLKTIVQTVNKQLVPGYSLALNPDGAYAITGRDRTSVKNILLHTDGKFYVTEPNGTESILPPVTVFMPKADYLKGLVFAGLDMINISTGEVSEIPFGGFPDNTTNELPRITSDMLPQYDRYLRSQLDKLEFLEKIVFKGTDPTIKWTLRERSWKGLNDVNGDGTKDIYAGLQLYTAQEQHTLSWSKIPLRVVPGFARVMDIDGISIFPAIIKNADPTVEKYSIFPLATDTARITAPQYPNNYTLKGFLDPAAAGIIGIQMGDISIRWLVVPDAYLLPNANIDFQGGLEVVKYFKEGVNPADDQAREDILRQGIQKGAFVGSSGYIWPAGMDWVLK